MSAQYLLDNGFSQDMINYITGNRTTGGLEITLNDDYSKKFLTLYRLFLQHYGVAGGRNGADIHFWGFLHNQLQQGEDNLQILDDNIIHYRTLWNLNGGKIRKSRKTKKRKSRKTKRRRNKMRGGALTEQQKTCFRNLSATLPNGNTISFGDFVDKPKFDTAAADYFRKKGTTIDDFCSNPSAYNIADAIMQIKSIYVMKYY
jgi:hypothetical protein